VTSIVWTRRQRHSTGHWHWSPPARRRWGGARVALERGEPDAQARFRQCAAAGAAGPDVLLGLASALEAESDPAGMALLEDAVVRVP
jgi:hypothetical protein